MINLSILIVLKIPPLFILKQLSMYTTLECTKLPRKTMKEIGDLNLLICLSLIPKHLSIPFYGCLIALWTVLIIKKMSTLLNSLNNVTFNLIMLGLLKDFFTYYTVCNKLIKLYGVKKQSTLEKTRVLSIKVAKDEIIPAFSAQFLF